jgi:diaminopimelate decarboxylase
MFMMPKNTIAVQPINKAFSVEKLRINYAMKALSNIILQLLKEMGSGLDAPYPFKSTIGSTCRI